MPTAAATSAEEQLQEGIYLQRGVPPPEAWRVLFLNINDGVSPDEAAAALAAVMEMLAELKRGRVRELAETRVGEAPGLVPSGTFVVLLGYGASFFDRRGHSPRLTSARRPRHLVPLPRPGPAFPSIAWKETAPEDGHSGEADLLLQFTGVSDHAVNRAAVETWKLIDEQQLPLTTSGTYGGFQRDDGRSWIGFHDGVSNLEPSERRAAVECPGDPDWNRGGTYLAFLRLEIALKRWRKLSRAEQEVIVGRDKLNGCPLEAVSNDGGELDPKVVSGCPFTDPAEWRALEQYRNPPETGDGLVEASHVHRVNQNRAAGTTPSAHRIFRQGYEYLEEVTPSGPRLGLNFVSFQNDLYHLQQVLGLDGWLGDVNFGGRTKPAAGEPEPVKLISLCAGGFYVVPPRAKPFPGASLFGRSSVRGR